MSREEIFETVVEIMKDVFEEDDLVVSEATSSADIDAWDSLSHLGLINDIEVEFGIKFTLEQIQNLKNVGELLDAISGHLA